MFIHMVGSQIENTLFSTDTASRVMVQVLIGEVVHQPGPVRPHYQLYAHLPTLETPVVRNICNFYVGWISL